MRRVYCDANATTPLLPEVMEAMRPYWMEEFGNASSIHLQGQKARKAVDQARETLARFFGCREAEVVFNSGGTEGDNTAIFGLLRAGDHFITTSIEHSAVLRAADRVAERGVEVTFVAPMGGWADRSGRDSSRDQAWDAAGRFPQDVSQRDAGK